MLIDRFINSASKKPDKNGTNKKCFLFKDYALLYGFFKEERLNQIIQISSELKDKGVFILPTLEYKVDIPSDKLGKSKGFLLQQRAEGEELYHRGMSAPEYRKRLKEIAQLDHHKLDKFIDDWLSITASGLRVDPSRCENFFYLNGKISFVDLNLQRRPVSFKRCFFEICRILTGLELKSKYKTNGDDLPKIITKVSSSFLKRGLELAEIQEVISMYSYFMDKQQIDSIICRLGKEKKSIKFSKILTEHSANNKGMRIKKSTKQENAR